MKSAIVSSNDLESGSSIQGQTSREDSTTRTFGPSVLCLFEGCEMSVAAIRIDLEARVKGGGHHRSIIFSYSESTVAYYMRKFRHNVSIQYS